MLIQKGLEATGAAATRLDKTLLGEAQKRWTPAGNKLEWKGKHVRWSGSEVKEVKEQKGRREQVVLKMTTPWSVFEKKG